MNTLKKTKNNGTIGAYSYGNDVPGIGIGVFSERRVQGVAFLEEIDGELHLSISDKKVKEFNITIKHEE